MTPKDIIIGAVERHFQFDKSASAIELKDITKFYSEEEIDKELSKAAKFYEENQYYLDRYSETMQGEIVRGFLGGIKFDLSKDISTDNVIDELTKIKKYTLKEENLIKKVKEVCGYNDRELQDSLDTSQETLASWEFDPETMPKLVKNFCLAIIENRQLRVDAEKFRQIKEVIEKEG